MSTEARAVHFPAADWDGGVHPYRVGHRKLGMWLFIVSDSLTFSALLIGYSYLRASNVWPTPFPFLSEHRLFVGNDLLSALVQLDDGLWRLGVEPRETRRRPANGSWQRCFSARLSWFCTSWNGTI